MNPVSIWEGQYSYDSKLQQKMIGFAGTNFKMEFNLLENNYINGKVIEDTNTGGMEGEGTIIGNIYGNKIEFVKQMPILNVHIGHKKIHKFNSKKHRPIYYSGIIAEDKKSMSGTWKFKFGFGFLHGLPMIYMPISGTWSARTTNTF